MYDYFIIGGGLAALTFAETAISNSKSVLVYTNNITPSSKVAAGVYNPVILKRFTAVSDALEQYNYLQSFFRSIENKLSVNFLHDLSLLRKFSSVEEQNNWFVAADKPNLSHFLNLDLYTNSFKNIDSTYHFGKVNCTGYLDTTTFIDSYKNYLSSINALFNESFDYTELVVNDEFVEYKGLKAGKIVFCEGVEVSNNPFFNYIPLVPAKGELLLINSIDLDIDVIIKAGIFILPLGNNLYKVGATYEWNDLSLEVTLKAKEELLSQLDEIISCDYEVIEQFVGIRPTVKDRKPIIGKHPELNNLYCFNGLGTRGVMIAPYTSLKLFNFIEKGLSIDSNIDISRFVNLYKK